MRNFKRFLTLALAVMMVVSMFAINTSAAAFTDVDEDNEYLAKAVGLLNHIGVIQGTSETTFSPDAPVTREQMAAFLYRIMNKGKLGANGTNQSPFTDLADPVFYTSVSWASQKGLVKGTSATTFNPKGGITLQDAYTMIVRALGYETEETLPYPFGYIGVAEDKNVDLCEGLDSTVDYTTALTRGDVAVILYNMFFAETGVAETKQVAKNYGTEENPDYLLITESYNPVFCEKYFDVFGVEYQVVATPGYALNGEKTTKSFGYDAVYFKEFGTANVGTKVENLDEFYFDFADLGLEGEADDYIMAVVKMYVTLDKDDQIDEVLYADSLLTKKTVNEMKFETVSTTTKNSYMVAGDNESAKLLTGKVTLGDEVAYFYNAPYSYVKPTYAKDASDFVKYGNRNANNLTKVVFEAEDEDFEQFTVTTGEAFVADVTEGEFANGATPDFRTQAEDLIEKFTQAYAGGLFAADIYDIDGDGIFEYIDYKPYGFYFAADNAKKSLGDTVSPADLIYDNAAAFTYYIGGANIVGGELEDGDAFVGYIDADNNTIYVAEVVAPVEAQITAKKANGTITLDNGEKVSATEAWKLANAADLGTTAKDLETAKYVVADVEFVANGLDTNDVYEQDFTFYVYDGAILFQDGITATAEKYEGNLIILDGTVSKADNTTVEYLTKNQWTATAGDAYFVTAYVDGELKLIPVEVDTDVTEMTPAVPTTDYETVAKKLATYTVDKNGVYTIKLLATAYNTEDTPEFIGIPAFGGADDELDTKEAGAQVIATIDGTVNLNKVTGNRFQLVEKTAGTGADTLASALPQLVVTKDTKVVIRREYTATSGKTKIEYKELGAEELTNSLLNDLTNVQVILGNDTKYETRENLVVLYGETTEEVEVKGANVAKADRIVVSYEVEYVDGEYVILYNVMNPYTGATEPVYGTKEGNANITTSIVPGDVIKLEAGKVNDEDGEVINNLGRDNVKTGTANTYEEDDGLFWVVGYDAETEMLEVMRYTTDVANDTTGAEDEDDVEYKEGEVYFVNVADAPIAVLKNTGAFQFNSSMSIKSTDVLTSEDEEYLAYNNAYTAIADAEDPDAKLHTVYGRYVKVFLNLDVEGDKLGAAQDEDNFHAEADYVVVIVNNDEDTDYCAVKDL